MAWDAHAKKLAIKTIGTVESNMKYDSIYYVDPITIGIMQWYAGRAADLLERLKSAPKWSGVANSLKNDLSAHPSSQWTWWSRRYLTKAEGESLRPLLASTEGVQAQNKKTEEDLNDYVGVAKTMGLSADSNTNAFIFWCVMYHQSPREANRILNHTQSPTLDNLYRAALNNSVFSKYKSRYQKAINIIRSGDTSGVPNTGGDSESEEEGGQQDPGNLQDAHDALIKHVRMRDNTIYIYTKTGIVTCYPTIEGEYIPQTGGNAAGGSGIPLPDDGSTTPPSNGGGGATADKVIKWCTDRLHKFRYSQGAGRMNSDSSGVEDCSSMVAQAYKSVMGVNVGSWTGEQEGRGKRIYDGPGSGLSQGIMQKADLILYWWNKTGGHSDHVELYVDGDRTIGHGGGMGPKYGPFKHLNNKARKVRVVRWIGV